MYAADDATAPLMLYSYIRALLLWRIVSVCVRWSGGAATASVCFRHARSIYVCCKRCMCGDALCQTVCNANGAGSTQLSQNFDAQNGDILYDGIELMRIDFRVRSIYICIYIDLE